MKKQFYYYIELYTEGVDNIMPINDKNILDKIKKQIEETDWSEVIKQEQEKHIQGQLRVTNRTYCDWLISFLDNLPEGFNDESWAYRTLKHNKDFTSRDEENVENLSHFIRFLHIVADIQRVKEYYDDRFFEEYESVFKYKDRYFEYNTIIGQGSITRVTEIERPNFAIIDLDFYFLNEDEGKPQSKYKDGNIDYDEDIFED